MSVDEKGRTFVYSLLPDDVCLAELEREYLSSVECGASLFRFGRDDYPEESEEALVFAVRIKDVGSARTEEACGIHHMLSKVTDTRSAVFFRHEDAFMLSFLHPLDDNGVSIYLSDWFDASSLDLGQFEQMHVASTSLDSAVSCFDGFAHESIRSYYKYPFDKFSAGYALLDSMNISWSIDSAPFTLSEVFEEADSLSRAVMDEYGDDFVEDGIRVFDDSDDFNLDDIEWELQNAEQEDKDEPPTSAEPSVSREVIATEFLDSIPQDAFSNPVTLLDWINAQPDLDVKLAAASYSGSTRQLAPVEWHEYFESTLLEVGTFVRHADLGDGTVVHSAPNQISVEFDGTRRVFAHPLAFRKCVITLLRYADGVE